MSTKTRSRNEDGWEYYKLRVVILGKTPVPPGFQADNARLLFSAVAKTSRADEGSQTRSPKIIS